MGPVVTADIIVLHKIIAVLWRKAITKLNISPEIDVTVNNRGDGIMLFAVS